MVALLSRLLAEQAGVRGLPAGAPVGALEDPVSRARVDGLGFCCGDCYGIDPARGRRDAQGPPAAAPVRALEDARFERGRKDRLWMHRVYDEGADEGTLESTRRPPPARHQLGENGGFAGHLFGASLRAAGSAAVVEAVEAEQADRGSYKRGGRVAAPAPARPLARLLDQRFERFGICGIVGARGP